MAEIINLHDDINEEDSQFNKFVEMMKGDLVRGAFIVYKDTGEVFISCNVYNKAQQIVMIYNLQKALEEITSMYTPDEEKQEADNED